MKFIIASLPIIVWLIFIIIFTIRHNNKMKKINGRYTESDLLFEFFKGKINKEQSQLMKKFLIVLFLTLLLTMILSVFSFVFSFVISW